MLLLPTRGIEHCLFLARKSQCPTPTLATQFIVARGGSSHCLTNGTETGGFILAVDTVKKKVLMKSFDGIQAEVGGLEGRARTN